MLRHQDSWPSAVPPGPRLGRAGHGLPASSEDLLAAGLSPRSNTIPLIEIGRSPTLHLMFDMFAAGKSLENLTGADSSTEFHSLDRLDGLARGLSCRTPHSNRGLQDLDRLPGLQEFQQMGGREKHEAVLGLVPLLKGARSNIHNCWASSSHKSRLMP